MAAALENQAEATDSTCRSTLCVQWGFQLVPNHTEAQQQAGLWAGTGSNTLAKVLAPGSATSEVGSWTGSEAPDG